MDEEILVPQVVLEGIVKRRYQHFKVKSWELDAGSITRQAQRIAECLSRLGQEAGTVIVWQEIDPTFSQNEIFLIEQELEKLVQESIPENWEVEAVTPKTHTGAKNRYDVSRIVHSIFKRFPFEIFAQATGFGHGRMYDLIFMEAIRQFENRYAAIYFDGTNTYVDIADIVPSQSGWMSEFEAFIMDYDYMAAYELLNELEETSGTRAAKSLLKVMIHRLNFDFTDAEAALKEGAAVLGGSHVLGKVEAILAGLLSSDPKIRDLARITELYRHLSIFLELDDMVSFLIRFYRGREAILFYLLEHITTGESGLAKKRNSTIYQVIEVLEELYDKKEIDSHYGTYFYLKSDNVAKLLQGRNKSFIGHSRGGIDNDVAWFSYFGTSRTSIVRAKRRFLLDSNLMFREFGIEADENFKDVNRELIRMALEFAGKEAAEI